MAAIPEQPPVSREVLERFEKGRDLEVHVSIVTVGEASWVEVSDYVPSRDSYRRGIVLPKNIKQRVGAAIRKAELDAH